MTTNVIPLYPPVRPSCRLKLDLMDSERAELAAAAQAAGVRFDHWCRWALLEAARRGVAAEQ